VFWTASFVATHLPPPPEPISAPHFGDKLIHFGMFFTISLLGMKYLRSQGRDTVRRRWLWVFLFAVYGILDETTQPLVGRSAEWGDFLADLLGILAGTHLSLLTSRFRVSQTAR
jgi:VanZ family protein